MKISQSIKVLLVALGYPPELALPIALFEVIGFLPTIVEEPLNDMVNMIDSAH